MDRGGPIAVLCREGTRREVLRRTSPSREKKYEEISHIPNRDFRDRRIGRGKDQLLPHLRSFPTCADGLIKNSGYVAAWQIPSDPLISFVHLDGIATHSTARADSNKRSARAARIRYAGPRTTSPDFQPSILASY